MTSFNLESKTKNRQKYKKTLTGPFFQQNSLKKQSILVNQHQQYISTQYNQTKNQINQQKQHQINQKQAIQCNFNSFQSKKLQNLRSSHQNNCLKEKKRKKIQKKKKGPHKTKNYLQFLKLRHFKYLQQNMSQNEYNDLFNDPKIKYIRGKLGMGLQDFQYLYRSQPCRKVFTVMFEEGSYLELSIMISKKKQKMEYLKKLDVLRNAFAQQRFQCLNQSSNKIKQEER